MLEKFQIIIVSIDSKKIRTVMKALEGSGAEISRLKDGKKIFPVIKKCVPNAVLIDNDLVDAGRVLDFIKKENLKHKVRCYATISPDKVNIVNALYYKGLHGYFIKEICEDEVKVRLLSYINHLKKQYELAYSCSLADYDNIKLKNNIQLLNKKLNLYKVKCRLAQNKHKTEKRELKDLLSLDQQIGHVYSSEYITDIFNKRVTYISKMIYKRHFKDREIGKYAKWESLTNSNNIYSFSVAYLKIIGIGTSSSLCELTSVNKILTQIAFKISSMFTDNGISGRIHHDSFLIVAAKGSKELLNDMEYLVNFINQKLKKRTNRENNCVCVTFETRLVHYGAEDLFSKLKEDSQQMVKNNKYLSLVKY